uniref:Uncharacterized protein n=1 Tax=Romanomermis culicivorax TaxID=13658 RepID=A0A915I7M3_ROMCU
MENSPIWEFARLGIAHLGIAHLGIAHMRIPPLIVQLLEPVNVKMRYTRVRRCLGKNSAEKDPKASLKENK